MPVCRICLKETLKSVYSMEYGEPKLREKLRFCLPQLDFRLFRNEVGMCESCMNDLNLSYEFFCRVLWAQTTLMCLMGPRKDFENLEKYEFEASSQNLRNEKEAATLPVITSAYSLNETDPEIKPEIANDDNIDNDQYQCNNKEVDNCATVDTATVGHEEKGKKRVQVIPMPTKFNDNGVDVKKVKLSNAPAMEYMQRFMEGKMCYYCCRQYPNKTCLQSHIHIVHRNKGSNSDTKRNVLINLLSGLTTDELKSINREVAKECAKTRCEKCHIILNCIHEMQYHITKIHKKYPINDVHFMIKCLRCQTNLSHKYLELHLEGHRMSVDLHDIFMKRNYGAEPGPFLIIKFHKCKKCKALYNSTDDHSHCSRGTKVKKVFN